MNRDMQQRTSDRDQLRAPYDDSSDEDASHQRAIYRDAPSPTIGQRRSQGDARHFYAHGSYGYDESQRWYPAHHLTQVIQPVHSTQDHRSRFTTPTSSGTSAGPPSATSALSDRDSSPRFSPDRKIASWPPLGSVLPDQSEFTAHGAYAPGPYYAALTTTYVAMTDVQAIADEAGDLAVYSQSHPTAYPFDQRYQLSHAHADGEHNSNVFRNFESRTHPGPQARVEQAGSVTFHHRRTQSAGADRTTSGRVGRRPRIARSRTSYQQDASSGPSSTRLDRQPNTFPCLFVVYGCNRRFSSKNEWKRHIQTTHVITEDWWCSKCTDGGSFNRKDLFMQHIFRMHTPRREQQAVARGGAKAKSEGQKRYEDTEAQECYRRLRQPPESSRCVVCGQAFHGPGSWEQCIDHVGRHLDTAAKGSNNGEVLDWRSWHQDHDLEHYLRTEGLFPPNVVE